MILIVINVQVTVNTYKAQSHSAVRHGLFYKITHVFRGSSCHNLKVTI
jgi:hypothetical protein